MKFKEIKHGMAIHCKNDEEKKLLLEEAERLGYTWANGDNPTEYDCRGTTVHFHGNDESKYKYITQSNQTRYVTEFSDLIIPELTAEEVIEWFRDYFISNEFIEVFGDDYSMSGLTSTFSPAEIVSRIAQWKSDHEKEEPEIETVDICRIVEVLPDGRKRCVHEEDIDLPFDGYERQKVEEILKRYCMEHDGEYIAVREVVSRVKAVE